MKLFKLISVLLISVLTFSIFTGCSEKSSDSKNASYTFYFIRHGETTFNKAGIAQGWVDSPLTEEGIAQAKKLGKGMEDIDFTAAYTSISERAYDTANYVLAGTDVNPFINEDLKEINFGSMEGGSSDAAWEDLGLRLNEGWSNEGGETMKQVGERVRKAVDLAIEENPEGGNILISSHGIAITSFVETLFTDSEVYADFMGEYMGEMPNCSVTKVTYKDGKFTLVSMGDLSYIE